jgi:hypothetical protein
MAYSKSLPNRAERKQRRGPDAHRASVALFVLLGSVQGRAGRVVPSWSPTWARVSDLRIHRSEALSSYCHHADGAGYAPTRRAGRGILLTWGPCRVRRAGFSKTKITPAMRDVDAQADHRRTAGRYSRRTNTLWSARCFPSPGYSSPNRCSCCWLYPPCNVPNSPGTLVPSAVPADKL